MSVQAPADRSALVLTGGGARAAYQVGVLRGIASIARKVQPERTALPFPIVCGSSAGAINAMGLAVQAENFRLATARLAEVWGRVSARQIYRTDSPGVASSGARWLAAMALGWLWQGANRPIPRSLFDNRPLAALLESVIDFKCLPHVLANGTLDALAISALNYSTGRHITFYESAHPIQPWSRAQRTASREPIGVEHLLASSAIPYLFPAAALERDGQPEYFGDGSVRQLAPLSPAIHLGASRILVIGVAPVLRGLWFPGEATHRYPTLAQIGGHALASMFHDGLINDIERLRHTNELLAHLSPAIQATMPVRHIDLLVIAPTVRMEEVAARHFPALPATIRTLLSVLGAQEPRGAALASYLLFEAEYTRELMDLGRQDAWAQRDAIEAFLLAQPLPMNSG